MLLVKANAIDYVCLVAQNLVKMGGGVAGINGMFFSTTVNAVKPELNCGHEACFKTTSSCGFNECAILGWGFVLAR